MAEGEHVGEPLAASDPRRIGPYELLCRLGTGAMGRVYLGRRDDGQPAAVKLVHANLAGIPVFRQRFKRELAVVGRVGGERVARVLDADADAEQPWIATECVEGPSLHELVQQRGPLPPEWIRALACDVAQALSSIHEAGVVHRDLKPANVLIAGDGARVIDFGVAHAADASILTNTGHTPGTPAYMAPEQAAGQQVVPATDVHALGAMLFFAATGRQPFGEAVPLAVMNRIINQAPDLDGFPEDDAELRGLVERCLAKMPEERPTTTEIVEACDTGTRPDWSDFVGTRPAFVTPWLREPDPGLPSSEPVAPEVSPTDPEGPRRLVGRRVGIAAGVVGTALAILVAAMLHDGSDSHAASANGPGSSTTTAVTSGSPAAGGPFPTADGSGANPGSATPSDPAATPGTAANSHPSSGPASPASQPHPTTAPSTPRPSGPTSRPTTAPPTSAPHTKPPSSPPSTGAPPPTPAIPDMYNVFWWNTNITWYWNEASPYTGVDIDLNGARYHQDGNGGQWTMNNLSTGVNYCAKVRAVNGTSVSGWSAPLCHQT